MIIIVNGWVRLVVYFLYSFEEIHEQLDHISMVTAVIIFKIRLQKIQLGRKFPLVVWEALHTIFLFQ